MNKIMFWLKNILIIFNIILLVIFYKVFGSTSGFSSFIYNIVLIFILVINIKDAIKKNKIIYDKMYNLLFVFVELISLFIIVRALFDQSFIYTNNYLETMVSCFREYDFSVCYNLGYPKILYLSQNLWYLIIMLLLIMIYRRINIDNRESKYSYISLICFFISIFSLIPTLNYLTSTFSLNNIPLLYLLFNIVLLVTEIIELIRNNGIKREWIIFVSFIFNLFAFISIFT